MSDDKLVKEVIKYAKNHKVLSKMDLDFTKDFSKINEYKNAEERGENVSIKKDLNTNFNIGLYIYGPSRLGKTTISKTFTYHLKKLGVDAEVLKANTISTITENFNPINTLKTKKVLTIDDIGIGYITPFYLAQLIELLDYRAEKGLLTFFNSNYSKERLCHFFEENSSIEYAERLYSRIQTLAKKEVFFEEEKEI